MFTALFHALLSRMAVSVEKLWTCLRCPPPPSLDALGLPSPPKYFPPQTVVNRFVHSAFVPVPIFSQRPFVPSLCSVRLVGFFPTFLPLFSSSSLLSGHQTPFCYFLPSLKPQLGAFLLYFFVDRIRPQFSGGEGRCPDKAQ